MYIRESGFCCNIYNMYPCAAVNGTCRKHETMRIELKKKNLSFGGQ